jgi:hypothetical protein
MSETAGFVGMSVDEALKFAHDWSSGMTVYTGQQGWRVVCMILAEEVERLRKEVDDCKNEILEIGELHD